MPAADHLRHQQLAMFMHPDDFHAQVEPNDWGRKDRDGSVNPERDASGWAKKLRHSHESSNDDVPKGSTLHKEVSANGIERPVSVWHPTDTEVRSGWKGGAYLRNGHHRVAVATDLTAKGKTTYIPVEHTEASVYYADMDKKRAAK